jgi:hypothetical protein
MRPSTIQLLLLISIIILTTSCSGQSLSGRWKLRQVDLMDVPHQTKQFTIDLSKPDKMKAVLYEATIPKKRAINTDSIGSLSYEIDDIDTTVEVITMKTDIDKYVASSFSTSMTLKADNKFYMISNGLIVPNAVPGGHFGDTLKGKWTKNKDTLVLTIGADQLEYKWKFKILQVTNKDLKLQEVFDGFEGRGNELRFVRQ